MSAKTIVLIHGLWMTPRSWENWIPYYESRGYNVIAPGYPGFEIEVEALRENPSVIANLTVEQVVAHQEGIIGALDAPPIIIGHSFGGTLTQILLDHGFGAAGVGIDSAQTEGVLYNPPSQIKALFPLLANPTHYNHALGFTPEQFHYAFTNTLSAEESQKVYDRYHIPTPGTFVWTGVLANVIPGHQATWVNYKNDDRAPLLFIAGGADNIMPPVVNKQNAHLYHNSKAVTEYHEFPGRDHWTCAAPGWEAVADYALEWAEKAVTGRVA